jgi:hypothetical protein
MGVDAVALLHIVDLAAAVGAVRAFDESLREKVDGDRRARGAYVQHGRGVPVATALGGELAALFAPVEPKKE